MPPSDPHAISIDGYETGPYTDLSGYTARTAPAAAKRSPRNETDPCAATDGCSNLNPNIVTASLGVGQRVVTPRQENRQARSIADINSRDKYAMSSSLVRLTLRIFHRSRPVVRMPTQNAKTEPAMISSKCPRSTWVAVSANPGATMKPLPHIS